MWRLIIEESLPERGTLLGALAGSIGAARIKVLGHNLAIAGALEVAANMMGEWWDSNTEGKPATLWGRKVWP